MKLVREIVIGQSDVWSPSMRREWIEMLIFLTQLDHFSVSLHAEGVD